MFVSEPQKNYSYQNFTNAGNMVDPRSYQNVPQMPFVPQDQQLNSQPQQSLMFDQNQPATRPPMSANTIPSGPNSNNIQPPPPPSAINQQGMSYNQMPSYPNHPATNIPQGQQYRDFKASTYSDNQIRPSLYSSYQPPTEMPTTNNYNHSASSSSQPIQSSDHFSNKTLAENFQNLSLNANYVQPLQHNFNNPISQPQQNPMFNSQPSHNNLPSNQMNENINLQQIPIQQTMPTSHHHQQQQSSLAMMQNPQFSNGVNFQQPIQPHSQQQQPPQQGFPAGQFPYSSQPIQSRMPSFPPNQRPGLMSAPNQRISPDQLPDYINMKRDLASKYGSIYETSSIGCIPPSFLSIIYRDTGNASPRFVRSTCYLIPNNGDVLKQCQVPLSLIITPFADTHPNEEPVHLTKFEGTLPIRCSRCKCYMNPFAKFVESGNKFKCQLCDSLTEVPTEYFANLNFNGQRVDNYMKPELCLSSYDIAATIEYCEHNKLPKPAKFVFLIDVSYAGIKAGILSLLRDKLRTDVLEFLPKEKSNEQNTYSPVEIALIAFDSKLYFFNFENLKCPDTNIISDVNEPFIPFQNGLFLPSNKLSEDFDTYMKEITKLFDGTQQTSSALGPAILSASNALKVAESPGKIFVFTATMPTDTNVGGHLTHRDEQNLLGTDKEKIALNPASNYYTNIGRQCTNQGCAIDLFLFTNQFIDVSSLSEVSKMSGGQVYYYRYFNPINDGERFLADLRYTVSRSTAFNAVMRVRSSNAVRPIDYVGSFTMNNSTDMEFGAIDCDKTICVDFTLDDKLAENSNVYFQVALLYTTFAGKRLIRVHNLCIPTTTNILAFIQNTNFESTIAYIIKIAARSLLQSPIAQIRQNVLSQLSAIFSAYRNQSPNSGNLSLLVLPENLKVLPLFVNSLLKCDAIAGVQSVSPDFKNWLLTQVQSMTVEQIIGMLYPSLFALEIGEFDKIKNNRKISFVETRCMYELLDDSKIYILDTTFSIWIWIGNKVPIHVLADLFNVNSSNDPKLTQMDALPSLETDISIRVNSFITEIMITRKRLLKIVSLDAQSLRRHLVSILALVHPEFVKISAPVAIEPMKIEICVVISEDKVNIIKQGHTLEMFFKNYLVEDTGLGNSTSYTDFLFQLHGEVRSQCTNN